MTRSPYARNVVQRTDRFVGRTTNWLYDHLRHIPRHVPVVFADLLENRREYPLIEARARGGETLLRRAWRRLTSDSLFPSDARWLRKVRPALLHSHFGDLAADDYDLHEFLGVPWVASFYGADVYEFGRRPEWIERYARLFASTSLVLALGPRMADELEAIGCPRSKLKVHALGVDVESIPARPRSLPKGQALKILFAGTFREKKGIEYVIQGAAEARRRGVRLELTLVGDAALKPGDAETKATVFSEIARLNMRDVVTHHSYVEFDRLIQLALDSHVFLAPSVTSATGDAEGTPFVLQQMMATGMPVIATIHSDIPFILGQYRDRLVPERDSRAIAQRLQYYAEQPDRLSVEGGQLREQICSHFDVRRRAVELSSIYDGVLGNA